MTAPSLLGSLASAKASKHCLGPEQTLDDSLFPFFSPQGEGHACEQPLYSFISTWSEFDLTLHLPPQQG